MQYVDNVYGEIEIKEKVILDIINTKAFSRLKKITQAGSVNYIQSGREMTRYEHCIGTWYLSYLYQRPMEEQIACLIHDISHTAFSHVIDIVVKEKTFDFGESKLTEIILKSDIPKIIKKYGYNLDNVLNKSQFPLLNNDLPDISFDRYDYFLRDGYTIGFLPKQIIELFLQNILEKDQKLYFTDVRIASTYAIMYASFSRLIWLDPTAHGSFFLLAGVIKEAISDGLISEKEFFSDDITLMKKFRSSKNPHIIRLLKRLKPGNEFVYAKKDEAEFYGPNKPRTVDPLVMVKGKLERLSSLVPSLGYFFEEFKSNYKFIGVKPKI